MSTQIVLGQTIIGKSYITTAANIEVVIKETSSQNKFLVPLGTKFRVDAIEDDSNEVRISFWDYGRKEVESFNNKVSKPNFQSTKIILKSTYGKALFAKAEELTASDIGLNRTVLWNRFNTREW